MDRENWKKSPWVISIVTALFSLFLTIGYDYLKEKPILTTIWTIIKWIGNLIWDILNFEIKIWWIVVTLILLITTIIIIAKIKNVATQEPDFYNYRTGKFKRWKWSWLWKLNDKKNAWIISDLKAHCPSCETPMIDNSSYYGFNFDCPRCDFKAKDEQCDELHKIERIILDNIDRKNY